MSVHQCPLAQAGQQDRWLLTLPGCVKTVAGNLDGYGTDARLAVQIDRFEGQLLADVINAWRRALGPFGELTESPLGATPARWASRDGLAHEADLRPALAVGSRLPNQVRAWQWSTDSAPWLDVDLPFPFSWAAVNLSD
jgi:hypothetical protein